MESWKIHFFKLEFACSFQHFLISVNINALSRHWIVKFILRIRILPPSVSASRKLNLRSSLAYAVHLLNNALLNDETYTTYQNDSKEKGSTYLNHANHESFYRWVFQLRNIVEEYSCQWIPIARLTNVFYRHFSHGLHIHTTSTSERRHRCPMAAMLMLKITNMLLWDGTR